jgi:hypothetical protein
MEIMLFDKNRKEIHLFFLDQLQVQQNKKFHSKDLSEKVEFIFFIL